MVHGGPSSTMKTGNVREWCTLNFAVLNMSSFQNGLGAWTDPKMSLTDVRCFVRYAARSCMGSSKRFRSPKKYGGWSMSRPWMFGDWAWHWRLNHDHELLQKMNWTGVQQYHPMHIDRSHWIFSKHFEAYNDLDDFTHLGIMLPSDARSLQPPLPDIDVQVAALGQIWNGSASQLKALEKIRFGASELPHGHHQGDGKSSIRTVRS